MTTGRITQVSRTRHADPCPKSTSQRPVERRSPQTPPTDASLSHYSRATRRQSALHGSLSRSATPTPAQLNARVRIDGARCTHIDSRSPCKHTASNAERAAGISAHMPTDLRATSTLNASTRDATRLHPTVRANSMPPHYRSLVASCRQRDTD